MHTLKTLFAVLVLSFSALGAEPLKALVGWPVLVPGLAERVAVADASIAVAQVTPDGVKIRGLKEGVTSVTVWRSSAGAPELVTVQVEATGWNLKPVLVSSIDLEAGTVVTTSMVETRLVPEAMLTSSVVKPEASLYIIGQTLQVPVQKGDLLLWSAFETKKK